LPAYATEGAAGLDLRACLDAPIELAPGELALVPTGLALAIPPGHVGLIRDRSSLAVAGLVCTAGVIDSDYRGEVMVALRNLGSSPFLIHHEDRIAQMLLLPCPQARVVELSDLPATRRGVGGFGSTGR